MPLMEYDNSHESGVTTLMHVGDFPALGDLTHLPVYIGAGAALGWVIAKRPVIGALVGLILGMRASPQPSAAKAAPAAK